MADLAGVMTGSWNGFTRHLFPVAGTTAWVVEQPTALPGNPAPVVEFILRHTATE